MPQSGAKSLVMESDAFDAVLNARLALAHRQFSLHPNTQHSTVLNLQFREPTGGLRLY